MESVRIALTKGQWSWIDEEDYPSVSRFKWCANEKECGTYAVTYVRGYGYLTLHSFLMQPPPGKVVDHIDGDSLNNRRSNLRVVTQSQNLMNKRVRRNTVLRFKGVNWDKSRGKWMVKVQKEREVIWIGRFDDEIDAALAYNEAARIHFGEYARLNSIPVTEPF